VEAAGLGGAVVAGAAFDGTGEAMPAGGAECHDPVPVQPVMANATRSSLAAASARAGSRRAPIRFPSAMPGPVRRCPVLAAFRRTVRAAALLAASDVRKYAHT